VANRAEFDPLRPQTVHRSIRDNVHFGYEWVFRHRTDDLASGAGSDLRRDLVIPVRPGFFDLAAVRETVSTAREANKPYAVVMRTLVQPPSVNKIAGARSASARWASPAMALSAAL
jgi:hypothetical protein